MFLPRLALATAVAMVVSGCAPSLLAKSGEPVLLAAGNEKDSDVIWMTRKIEVGYHAPGGWETRTVSALFACYRQPKEKPGPPVCYIAKYEAAPGELMWPGLLWYEKDGRLLTTESAAPAATPPAPKAP